MYYTVRPGDNLWSIAQQFGVTPQVIMQANNITNPNMIYVGQRLYIPVQQPGYPQYPPTQPPTSPTNLEQRVERLERQYRRLEREVDRLNRRVNQLEQG